MIKSPKNVESEPFPVHSQLESRFCTLHLLTKGTQDPFTVLLFRISYQLHLFHSFIFSKVEKHTNFSKKEYNIEKWE